MKKFLFILIVLFSAGLSSFAQEDEATDERIGKLQEKMQQYIQKRLSMTKAESEKFTPIYLRYISELRKTHREYKTDRPMLQLKIAEVRVKFRDEFRPVFGEQRANRIFIHQKEFEDKIRQEIMDRRMQNRQGPRGRIKSLPL